MSQSNRLKGTTIFRPIIYGNTAVVLSAHDRNPSIPTEHTHRWTVAVRSAASSPDSDIVGGADDLGYYIKRVSFKLHDTYPNPTRNVDKSPFEVTETGWGEFEIQIRITFIQESGEKPIVLYHHLKLHPWNNTGDLEAPGIETAIQMGPVHSWQYDEIVFNDPFQPFLNILTSHPPTPLPRIKRRPVPFNLANPASLEASKGGVPEFNTEMEKEEAERLDTALKLVVAEHDRWRGMLFEKELELKQLQQELAGGAD